jgi:hypothetical protein
LQPERGTMVGKITANYDLLKLKKNRFWKIIAQTVYYILVGFFHSAGF